MGLFLSSYLPVLIALAGSFLIYRMRTRRSEMSEVRAEAERDGRVGKALEMGIYPGTCAQLRESCREGISEEIGKVHDKLNALCADSARRDGEFSKAIAVLEEGVREIKRANERGRLV